MLFLVLLIAEPCLSYPQTITHGYKSCASCHISSDGGDALNNYGRAMTEEFMATFAKDGEAREFLGLAESDSIDLGLDYRSMELDNVKTGQKDRFPMYSIGQLAVRHAGLTLALSAGYFGHDRTYQTRAWWVNYNVNSDGNRLDFKLGYWMPVVGIGLDNHDLSIKKGQGFGRGQERFIAQMTYGNRWFEAKFMNARKTIRIEQNDDNWPKDASKSPDEYLWQVLFQRIDGIEFGIHNRQTDGINTLQGFSARIAKGHAYILLEQDLDPSKAIRTNYGRVGIYPFRGFDLFFEDDSIQTLKSRIDRRALGFSWMIRPRLEYEGSYNQWAEQRIVQTSLKLWL